MSDENLDERLCQPVAQMMQGEPMPQFAHAVCAVKQACPHSPSPFLTCVTEETAGN